MSRWRKIETEGLPEEFEYVLWLKWNGTMDIGYLAGHEKRVYYSYDRWQPISVFSHWMPLPKPPKD